MDSSNSASVVIIGAGIAGVSSALKLIHNGFRDVTILEAQDYVGGRVKAVEIDGKPADLGAQFIHGRVGNPVYDIAEKLKRIPFEASVNEEDEKLTNSTEVFFTSSGHRVYRDKVDDLITLLEDGVDENLTRGKPGTVKEALDKSYQEFLHNHESRINSDKRKIYDAVFKWHSKYVKIDNAAEDLNDIPLSSNYIVLPGERFTNVNDGMWGLLSTLADQLPSGTVKLNKPVSRIDWENNATDNKSKPVLVTCQDGQTFEADHVIVTVSIGCLKATHKSLFQPELPIPVQQAVEHTGWGAIGKVYLQFEESFWETHKNSEEKQELYSYELLWTDSELPHIKSDRSQKKTKYGYPWWYGLHSVETVHTVPRLLEFWLTEEQLEVCEDLDDDEVKDVCVEVIRHFLKDITVPDPIAVYRTKWLTNPYTKGSYTYQSCKFTQKDQEHFGQPLPNKEDPRVLFAGEAYHPEFSSAFHGALLTGDQMADLLLTKYDLEPKTKLIDLVK